MTTVLWVWSAALLFMLAAVVYIGLVEADYLEDAERPEPERPAYMDDFDAWAWGAGVEA